ncbi:MAG: hypothetical protein KKC03_13700 [Bacteroidetes bacterium]|nr:hypothetical protein [Bacteroidota bacterium]
MYGIFRSPIYCPNVRPLGYDKYKVSIGDLIIFAYPNDKYRRLARVVGVAKKTGTRELYKPRTVLAAMEMGETGGSIYLRHVKIEWVERIVEPGKWMHRVFFESILPDPDTLAALDKHGGLSDHYIKDYLDADGNIRKDWRKAWEAKLRPNSKETP